MKRLRELSVVVEMSLMLMGGVCSEVYVFVKMHCNVNLRNVRFTVLQNIVQ